MHGQMLDGLLHQLAVGDVAAQRYDAAVRGPLGHDVQPAAVGEPEFGRSAGAVPRDAGSDEIVDIVDRSDVATLDAGAHQVDEARARNH